MNGNSIEFDRIFTAIAGHVFKIQSSSEAGAVFYLQLRQYCNHTVAECTKHL